MLTIEKKEGCFVVKRNGNIILETFEKIKSDTDFANFYLGLCADGTGEVVLFSTSGEFVYKFTKAKTDVGVSNLLDKIVTSDNIIQSMKKIPSLDFWTDNEVVRAFRYKHADLNKKRLAACKDECKVDVLYGVEKTAIEKFLRTKQFLKMSKPHKFISASSKKDKAVVDKSKSKK